MTSIESTSISTAAGSGRGLRAWYRPDEARPLLPETSESRRLLRVWRWRVFAASFFGYLVLYFGRKNISAALPVLASDLGLRNVEVGFIGTTLYITYGLGKLLNGMLADRANIRVFMATGLVASGALNLCFGSVSSLWLLAFFWGANGWFQSMGFPPIARALTLWFPPDRFKTSRWALWTCSHQLGTALIMPIVGVLLAYGSWRLCFWLPGALVLVAGLGVLWLMADTPAAKGLPTAVHFAPPAAEHGEGFVHTLVRAVLLNRNVWVIGLVDLGVYAVRFGTLDWMTKFLMEEKGFAVSEAAFRAGMMPAAGVVGVLVLGGAADLIFKGRYRMLNTLCLGGLAVCMTALLATDRDHPWLDLALLAGIGFFVEGPQSILGGVGAVDAGGSARVAASAVGLVGILSYFGASISGVGTGFLLDHYAWPGAFGLWVAMSVGGLLLCVFAWREKDLPRV
ncbi:MAG: MFS transporter [Deltaproteobacteria bacterium]|nr:MFS transporter [Deltaproteobacteria bacterium]